MKRIMLMIVLSCVFSLGLTAQDNVMLKKIREANATIQTFETDLHNTQEKSDKKTEQAGKLYFTCPNQFAALFDNGKHMIVNADRLKINIGIFNGTFKLRGSGMMRSLCNIFLYGFQGRCEELANENNYSIKVMQIGPYQQVYCTNKRKAILDISYKNVIFNYDKTSLMLRQIILIDSNNTVDTYSIYNTVYNLPVDPKVYTFNSQKQSSSPPW